MGSEKQDGEWQILHDRIDAALLPFGRKNAFREGDYWLLDDDWGRHRQELEVQNLNLLELHIIKLVQRTLSDFSDWCITVRVDVPGKKNIWPGMGLIIYPDEIVDELQREYLPQAFRDIVYK